MRRARLVGLALAAITTRAAAAQQQSNGTGTITIVIGAEPTKPVPTVSAGKADVDIGNILFFPLAWLGSKLNTADEKSFEPALAKRWTRPDPKTLIFELDPRAKWHDGVPVTSRDVVWSMNRARDSSVSSTEALLLRQIESVTADGPGKVVFRFKEAYAEQMYDAVYHVQPLPAHLLDSIPASRLDQAAFIKHPVGNGPYRWDRMVPGQRLELSAVPDFFLGRPQLERVIFLFVRSAEAQLNLLLDGTADAYESAVLARQITPIVEQPKLRILTNPWFSVGYLLFNRKAYGDRSKPHPILADRDVRRALVLGVDRTRLVKASFGPYGSEAEGPMGQASWVRRIIPKQLPYDPVRARALLEARGWRDSDGDGVRDKGGQPLILRMMYPGSSVPRVALAEPIQEMLRAIGVKVELDRLDPPIWIERRGNGQFDIDFSQTTFDPTPSGLVQSWSCAGIGGSNRASICDPDFDQALADAIRATSNVAPLWRTAIATLQANAAAAFIFAPTQTVVVHTRFRNVIVRPDIPWAQLWRWSVDPAERLPRDRR